MRYGKEVTKTNTPVSELVPTGYCCGDDGDDDTEPLAKTFFHIELAKSHVGHAYKHQLYLPTQFARALPNTAVPVILTRGGRNWETTYHGEGSLACNKRFDSRWILFVKDNMLKVGDVCVFELLEQSDTALKFKVRVLRGDFPSDLLDNLDGTAENPIVVH